MTHHEELLAQAIVRIAEVLGGEINVPLTGPEVLVLAEETAERIGELVAATVTRITEWQEENPDRVKTPDSARFFADWKE